MREKDRERVGEREGGREGGGERRGEWLPTKKVKNNKNKIK